MKCVHCGLCCVDYIVVIIDPEYANENFNMKTATENMFAGKKSFDPCPHLYWEDHESRCRIHHFKWYNKTPCYAFGQYEENPDEVCRLGAWILKNRPGYYERYCEEFKKTNLDPEEFSVMMAKAFKDEKQKIEKSTTETIKNEESNLSSRE